MKALVVLALVMACSSDSKPAPPANTSATLTDADRRAAIGDVSGLSAELQRAFDPIDHEPMHAPSPNDWLDAHPEPGQTFTFHGFRFRVLRRERNRITALRITPLVRKPVPAMKPG